MVTVTLLTQDSNPPVTLTMCTSGYEHGLFVSEYVTVVPVGHAWVGKNDQSP